MRDRGFMKMIFGKLDPETELTVELRCREVKACNDIDKIRAFCIDLMKNHAKTEAVLSHALLRLVELEVALSDLKAKEKAREKSNHLKLLLQRLREKID